MKASLIVSPVLCLVTVLPAVAKAQQGTAHSESRANSPARGDEAGPPGEPPPSAAPAAAPAVPTPASSPVVFAAYVEAFYQWNFNRPSNRLTNFRGFDNRHDTFTLANVVFDAAWDHEGVLGRLTLQVGHTPSSYYMAEPSSTGASGANASSSDLWKYVQQAYAGYRFEVGRKPSVLAGIFLSPIGPESMAVKDNWNWSRSNLFYGLPFYHTGARVTYPLTDGWAVTLAVYNGWNSVVDNNEEKSVSAQIAYARDHLTASLLYFGGVERAPGAPEGRAGRHLLDAHATWNVTEWLSLLAHANGGIEPNEFGTSAWVAGALYARARVTSELFFAARADAFCEHVAESGEGTASPIFWPAPWVASQTFTADYRPREHVSFRLEYRHDQAGGNMFFGGEVIGDGAVESFVSNRALQDTFTVGVTTWF